MLQRRRQRDPERERFWREAVAGHQTSGQSVRAYCSQRRLAEGNFYAWRRELVKRDRAASPALKLVPLQVRAVAIIEVVLPAGVVVRVPAGADAATVARLVAALGASSC
jgi:hypothetical protein